MIKFINSNDEPPFAILKEKYQKAIKAQQRNVEAVVISTFNKNSQEVDSRYVNLKYVDNQDFIFFTNYNSPKAKAIETHKQISALIYWDSINCQIRLKAKIKKTPHSFNQKYFEIRDIKKNALAISSCQSKPISSFDEVIKEYNTTKGVNDLTICPEYWGGFLFKPYYFEFWHGSDSRINKREVYEFKNNLWNSYYIQP